MQESTSPTREPAAAGDALFTESLRHLVRVSAAVAGAPLAAVRRTLQEAAGAADPAAVEEILLQSYLFAGFPRALNAMAAWREVSGTAAPAAADDSARDDPPAWDARGEAACRAVYGPVYETLRGNVRALHPALDEWMVRDGYGKVLARPGPGLAVRELCIVAACAAAEQEPQLRSHLRGALNCGATLDDLQRTIAALSDLIPREAVAAAREQLARLRESARGDD